MICHVMFSKTSNECQLTSIFLSNMSPQCHMSSSKRVNVSFQFVKCQLMYVVVAFLFSFFPTSHATCQNLNWHVN